MKLIVEKEFIDHFVICNRKKFKSHRFKKLFFSLKTWFLENYAEFDGYDLQEFSKWFCQECSLILTIPEIDLCQSDNTDFKCWDVSDLVSEHEHILKRYKIYYEDNNEIKFKIFHVPTNEYSYYNDSYRSFKKSNDFDVYKLLTLNTLKGLKKDKPDKKFDIDSTAFDSLKYLIRYFRNSEKIADKMSIVDKFIDSRINLPGVKSINFNGFQTTDQNDEAIFSVKLEPIHNTIIKFNLRS